MKLILARSALAALLAPAGTALAQTYDLGLDGGWVMPSSGSILKVSTGEIWDWTMSGNDNHSGRWGREGGDYNWTLTFDNPFDFDDFSQLVFVKDLNNDASPSASATVSVSGGTATLATIGETGTGSYDGAGTWTGGATGGSSWSAASSTGTFTSLSVTTSNVHAGDWVGSDFILNDGFQTVPEPSGALLSLVAAGLLAFRRRR